jgi:SAM-dependent methyltransferase
VNSRDKRPAPAAGRVHRIGRHYNHRIAPDRENFDVLDWASPLSQRARFEVLMRALPLRGLRLLDVGCGLGDLLAFLERNKLAADYTGVDILPKMVAAAQAQHPGGRFVAGDIFSASPFGPAEFDVVFCSGAFNLNLGNNLQFLPTALERFFELSRQHVVFNLLHKRAQSHDRTYFYYDPQYVMDVLKAFNCDCRVIDDYLPNDFTCVCTIRTSPSRAEGSGS